MLEMLLAIGAGVLIGNKKARDKAGEMVKETLGNVANSFVKKDKVVVDEQDKNTGTVSDATSTTSL